MLLAIWFGAGKAPFAPGTVGSLCALPLAYLLGRIPIWFGAGAVVACALLAFKAIGVAQRFYGPMDDRRIVVDEVSGLLLATLGLKDWGSLLFAFVLFRAMDVTKPWPIRTVERCRGPKGVLGDDLLAGLYAQAAFFGLRSLLGMFRL